MGMERKKVIRKRNPYLHKKIYERYFGIIPRDIEGRLYDIHHIDGNCVNNEPLNLVALSKKDHYDIHFKQGDWGAAQRLASELNLSPQQRSYISQQTMLELSSKGQHPWQQEENISKLKKRIEISLKKGTHNFSDPTFYDKYHSKEYLITFPDGHIEIIKNLAKFCRENDLNRGHMHKIISGRRKQHKGFKCQKKI